MFILNVAKVTNNKHVKVIPDWALKETGAKMESDGECFSPERNRKIMFFEH